MAFYDGWENSAIDDLFKSNDIDSATALADLKSDIQQTIDLVSPEMSCLGTDCFANINNVMGYYFLQQIEQPFGSVFYTTLKPVALEGLAKMRHCSIIRLPMWIPFFIVIIMPAIIGNSSDRIGKFGIVFGPRKPAISIGAAIGGIDFDQLKQAPPMVQVPEMPVGVGHEIDAFYPRSSISERYKVIMRNGMFMPVAEFDLQQSLTPTGDDPFATPF